MRFLQTADWHIGRRLFGYDLLAEQSAVLSQVATIAQEEQVDAIVIAGDLYDRQNPNETAVALLDATIQQLNLSLKLPLLVISGNHDSGVRLGVGADWFAETDYFLRTTLASVDQPLTLGDTQFFLLPYFEPFQARQFLQDDSIHTVAQAMTQLVARMQAQFTPGLQHVLVAHFFAAGSTHSDSETTVAVGGLDAVPLDQLAGFDYVALGHIHNKNALHSERVRYSGSLNKFSLSEVDQTKGVLIVETAPALTVKFRPVTPLHDVQNIRGAFADLSDPDYLRQHQIDQTAYTGIVLQDTNIISNASGKLKAQFPRFLTMQREQSVQLAQRQHLTQAQIKAPLQLLADFYQQLTDKPLTPAQQTWAAETLKEVDRS
ncbi:exonuclease SbcCD subunit D [Lapidilactobacillus achengensis]|uniref:Nuclease SbcCD subunit D n=1 Tax=Lapidilactobacillus achengensis TaxID=2486000 RepID=A0ABW1UL49_9LACO|nr:exonuclease SbcCD subunit D [Lapidilactobacillus achengensis]